MKNEGTKNVLLGVLIVGLVSMTVAFAALSTTLRIENTAEVAAQSWNVVLDNWALDTANSSASIVYDENNATSATDVIITEGTPSTSAADKATTAITGYNFVFKKPGAHVQYTFKIKNTGTILAQNTAITKASPVCTANGETVACPITYTVKCDNVALGTTPENGSLMSDLQPTNGEVSCTYFVGYNDVAAGTGNDWAGVANAISVDDLDITWVWEQK